MRPKLMFRTLAPLIDGIPYSTRHHVVCSDIGSAEDLIPNAVHDLDRHQLDAEGHAGRADPIVGELANRAADVSTVPIEIDRQIVVPDEISSA